MFVCIFNLMNFAFMDAEILVHYKSILGAIKGQVQNPDPYVTYSASQPARNVAQYLDGGHPHQVQQGLYTNILPPPQGIYEVLQRSNSEVRVVFYE